MRKLARSKSENVTPQTQRVPGLVGLLETLRAQLEACFISFALIVFVVISQNVVLISIEMLVYINSHFFLYI